jgi:hypothetical protein
VWHCEQTVLGINAYSNTLANLGLGGGTTCAATGPTSAATLRRWDQGQPAAPARPSRLSHQIVIYLIWIVVARPEAAACSARLLPTTKKVLIAKQFSRIREIHRYSPLLAHGMQPASTVAMRPIEDFPRRGRPGQACCGNTAPKSVQILALSRDQIGTTRWNL